MQCIFWLSMGFLTLLVIGVRAFQRWDPLSFLDFNFDSFGVPQARTSINNAGLRPTIQGLPAGFLWEAARESSDGPVTACTASCDSSMWDVRQAVE
ncbi:MAG: hypothetical protein NTY19_22435 [Planctomycetota bacterium]|nr:hypothetical protein [Planctomycetota bacterium]